MTLEGASTTATIVFAGVLAASFVFAATMTALHLVKAHRNARAAREYEEGEWVPSATRGKVIVNGDNSTYTCLCGDLPVPPVNLDWGRPEIMIMWEHSHGYFYVERMCSDYSRGGRNVYRSSADDRENLRTDPYLSICVDLLRDLGKVGPDEPLYAERR